MARPDFFAFLGNSLQGLSAEEPEAHRSLARAMGDLRAQLTTDGKVCSLSLDSLAWTMYYDDIKVDIEVAFDRQIVLDLIDGLLSLEDAILQERLRMQGSVTAIERFYDALMIYLEGLMRVPGTRALLEAYRSA